MNILIDIAHIPHVNFFKNLVEMLNVEGQEVSVICLNRGKNFVIAKEEFKGIQVTPIGKHRGKFISIIFEANIIRFFQVLKYCLFNRCDVGVSVGSFVLGSALKILKIPNIQFCDDPENKKNMVLQKMTATELFYPYFYKDDNIKNFKALKEWSYLSPKYFAASDSQLRQYGVKQKKYIFVREVNSGTTNYKGQSPDVVLAIAEEFPLDYPVILSLENKSNAELYPASWIILKEPVEDVHSLIYYSKIVISSGDSMAREGAMLGVPSIYCGIRDMAANRVLKDKGMLFHKSAEETPQFIQQIIDDNVEIEEQKHFRQDLETEWDDVTEFIMDTLEGYKKG